MAVMISGAQQVASGRTGGLFAPGDFAISFSSTGLYPFALY
jgi:hypothetical protein